MIPSYDELRCREIMKSANACIAPCHTIDADVVRLYQAYLAFYDVDMVDTERIRCFLTSNLTSGATILTASLDGHVTGFIQMYCIPNSLSLGRLCILNDLYVDAQYTRRGIGRALMHAAMQYCKDHHIDRMELSTGINNLAAQQLYAECGWKNIDAFRYLEYNLPTGIDPR